MSNEGTKLDFWCGVMAVDLFPQYGQKKRRAKKAKKYKHDNLLIK